MPHISTELFLSAIDEVVKANAAYIPPYSSGGSLYIRPNIFGSGATLGAIPSEEYTFNVIGKILVIKAHVTSTYLTLKHSNTSRFIL